MWLSQVAGVAWMLLIALASTTAHAQGDTGLRLEAIDVQPLPGQQVELKLKLSGAAPQPMSFTIENPARISLDLPNTALALSSRRQEANVGALTSILTAEANGRTRVVLNLNQMVPYDTRVEGDSVYVRIGQAPGAAAAPAFAAQPGPAPRSAGAASTAANASADRSIRNIDFRRGANGEWHGTLQSIEQRATIPVATVGLTGRSLKLGLPSIGGSFEGEVSADGSRLDLLAMEPDERARAGVFLAFQRPMAIPGVRLADFLRHAVTNVRNPARKEGQELMPMKETFCFS